ncbi:hypothetical protein ANI01nite_22750 [Glutamicibacter nicotianae]|uniref:Uncharacterized protein n=1 Tax=Glutamicibacter nicotianae TaxID=37929 RepID=A0ABQ0RMM8_GLUNI|nr:hypothetical protein ANI01nite_22750 [Glutamicibacter nicotianae]
MIRGIANGDPVGLVVDAHHSEELFIESGQCIGVLAVDDHGLPCANHVAIIRAALLRVYQDSAIAQVQWSISACTRAGICTPLGVMATTAFG